MIPTKLRHSLLMAERSHDPQVITAAINVVMEKEPGATLLDVEMTFRDAAADTYVLANPTGFTLVRGLAQALAQLGIGRMTMEQNRVALAVAR